ncbi:MAG: hypothetical protein SF162_07620 [bacterium]|nr:hypothetical protein [bacterium]
MAKSMLIVIVLVLIGGVLMVPADVQAQQQDFSRRCFLSGQGLGTARIDFVDFGRAPQYDPGNDDYFITGAGFFATSVNLSFIVEDLDPDWLAVEIDVSRAVSRDASPNNPTDQGIASRVSASGAWANNGFWPFGGTPANPIRTQYVIPAIVPTSYFEVRMSAPNTNVDTAHIRIHSICFRYTYVPPSGGLMRPLADTDANPQFGPHGIWDKATRPDFAPNPFNVFSPAPHLVVAVSRGYNQPVYAVAAGTVEAIQPVGSSCFGLNTSIPNVCLLRFDPRAFDENAIASDRFYGVPRDPLYVVRVDDQGTRYEYIVENAPNFIRLGQSIRQGCIIGQTTRMNVPSIDLATLIGVSYSPDTDLFGAFVSRLGSDGTSRVPLLADLTAAPTPTSACNADPDTAGCISAPLDDMSIWAASGGITHIVGGGGIILERQSQLRGSFDFVPGVFYSAVFTIDRDSDIGTARVALSVASQSLPSVSLTLRTDNYTVGPVEYQAGAPALVTITNLSSHQIVVTRICVTSGADAPTQRPDTCLFANQTFDEGLSSWQHSPTVRSGIAGGEISMRNGDEIWQNIPLYPNGNQPYVYNIYVKAWIPNEYLLDTSTAVGFSYEFGLASGTFLSPASTNSYLMSLFGGFPGREVTYNLALTVDQLLTSNFYITLNLTGDTQKIVYLREVCVNDAFDNFDNGGAGSGIVFAPTCNRISPPAGTAPVQDWLYFHWQSLDRFFQCTLMITLNRLVTIGTRTLQFIQWQMMYWQSFGLELPRFIVNVSEWANGHFTNLLNGRTTIVQGGQQCSGFDLGCLLSQLLNLVGTLAETIISPLVDVLSRVVDTLLALVTQAANLLFAVVNTLLSLFIMLITQLFNLWNQALSFLSSFVTAWNSADPEPLPLPLYCADPRSSATCRTLWVLENTIFSRLGALIIPVGVGGGSMLLLIQAFKKMRAAILEMGGA